MTKTLDEIWDGDLFGRREEAQNLEAYIESIWKRPILRKDSEGFVLAVDADYGMGKTFFLKKFKEQLELNHPVAYIDAWKDDLHDEPLIALLATLETALKPYFDKKAIVEDKYKEVIKKAQKIGGLMARGIFFRALGAIFTPKIVELMSDSLTSIDTDDEQEKLEDVVTEIEKDAIEGAKKVNEIIKEESYLRNRISKFKEAQEAIEDLKKSLRNLVSSLKSIDGNYPPIVIIIDELDRCRPTYAIKLLEEVKHLFDVEGIVFLLSVNKKQLSFSINHAYGSNFSGEKYISRFFDREYKLREIDENKRQNLVVDLINKLGISDTKFAFTGLEHPKGYSIDTTKAGVNAYFDIFDVSIRDSIKIIENLKTCDAITGEISIDGNYLMPLLINKFTKKDEDFYLNNIKLQQYKFKSFFATTGQHYEEETCKIDEYFKTIEKLLVQTKDEAEKEFKVTKSVLYKEIYFRLYGRGLRNHGGYSNPNIYKELINTLARFK